MNRTFLVTIDTNDADYQSTVVIITEEDFQKFLPLIKAINNFKPYVASYGVQHSNFVYGQDEKHEGVKSVYELYSQFDTDYIDDFIEIFVRFDLPFGMHTIKNIQEITLGERFVDGSYENIHKRESDNPRIQEYYKENKKYHETISSIGKPINCTPFTKMTPEELQLVRDHENLWKKYQD